MNREMTIQPFSFRSGSWTGKAAALVMVLVFSTAVVLYWEPQRTIVGLIGIALLGAMALACAVWWRVRVDPQRRRVRRLATLVGLIPLAWRTLDADRIAAVRLHGRRTRRWHDVWYVSLVDVDGEVMTLHWQTTPRTDEPTEAWELAQRIAEAIGAPVENKGVGRG